MFRKDLLKTLSIQPRSVSSIARELGLKRGDVEDDLRHLIRSARAAGHVVAVEPARCRACGFTFSEDKLSKPSRCPNCKATRLYEAQIAVVEQGAEGPALHPSEPCTAEKDPADMPNPGTQKIK